MPPPPRSHSYMPPAGPSRRCRARGSVSSRAALLCAFAVVPVLLFSAGGCATDDPPSLKEIQEQAGLNALGLDKPWREGGAEVGCARDNWLATFDDPQLAALVAEGMKANPDLRIAAVRIEQARQYVELAKSAMLPAINLFGTGGLNMGGGDISSALQGVSLGASWEPDLWGRMRYGRNAAEATEASVRADFEYARQSLAAAIARAWFTAAEASLQLKAVEEMTKVSGELVSLAEQRVKVGPGNQQEIALARVTLGNYQESVASLRLARKQASRGLELLLGRYPAAELAARTDLPALPPPIPAGLPLEMLERRPDMVAAERRVAAAFNRVGEAKAARLPRIILNANIAAIESDILQLKDDFTNPTGGVGARLIAPIYQGGALDTQVEIRTLEQKEAVAAYAAMALRALGEVETALASAQSLIERREALERVSVDAGRTLEHAQTQYRVGKGDLRAVQQQQLSLSTAELALLHIRAEQLAQRAALHLAIGGSFEAPPRAAGSAAD